MGPALGACTDPASGTDASEDPIRAGEDSIRVAVDMGMADIEGSLLQAIVTSAINGRELSLRCKEKNFGLTCSVKASARLDRPPPKAGRLRETIRHGIEDFGVPSDADVSTVDSAVMHPLRTRVVTACRPSVDAIRAAVDRGVRSGGGVRRRWLSAGPSAEKLLLSRRNSLPALMWSAPALKGVLTGSTCRSRGAISLPISRA